jgi:hypothetical protein
MTPARSNGADPDAADQTAQACARTRRLNCERCGRPFDCSLDGDCWCAAEPVRLPLPATGDCLCPDCLRDLTMT